MRQLCEWKGVRIVEAEVCPDHMLVEIPPKRSVSSFMGYLKGKAAQCCMSNSLSSNTGIGAESSGAEGTMWIREERTKAELRSTSRTSWKRSSWANNLR